MFKKLLSLFIAKKITNDLEYSLGVNPNAPEPIKDFFNQFDDDFEFLKQLKKENKDLKSHIESTERLMIIINDSYFGGDLWGDHLIDDENIKNIFNEINPKLIEIRDFARETDAYYYDNYLEIEQFANERDYRAFKLQEKYGHEITRFHKITKDLIANLHK